MVRKTMTFWKKVVFTDESKIKKVLVMEEYLYGESLLKSGCPLAHLNWRAVHYGVGMHV